MTLVEEGEEEAVGEDEWEMRCKARSSDPYQGEPARRRSPHHMAASYRTLLIYVLATRGDLALVYLPTRALVPALHPTAVIPDNSRRLLVRRLLPLQGFDLRLPAHLLEQVCQDGRGWPHHAASLQLVHLQWPAVNLQPRPAEELEGAGVVG